MLTRIVIMLRLQTNFTMSEIEPAMLYMATNVSLVNTMVNMSHDGVEAVVPNAESLAITRYIVQRLLVPAMTAFGFAGNAISIIVLTQRAMVSSTNCYLTALAIVDLLYLVFSFTLSLKHYGNVSDQTAYSYWYPYGRVFTDISSNASVCLTVTFTLERYIGVCHPMKGRVICTPKRARLIACLVICGAVVCTAPEFFEWKTVAVTENNKTTISIEDTALAMSDSYRVWYYWFLVTTFTLLPLILLCTFNGILIKSVLVATKIREQMAYMSVNKEATRRQGEKNKITLMLISVAIVFLVCQFPNAVLLLYRAYIQLAHVEMNEEDWNNVKIAGNFVNLLVLINASFNFVLYSVMSTKFRRVFLRTFCRFFSEPTINYTRTDLSYYNMQSTRPYGSSLRFNNKRLSTQSAYAGSLRRDSAMGIGPPRRNQSMRTFNGNIDTNGRIGPRDSVCSMKVHFVSDTRKNAPTQYTKSLSNGKPSSRDVNESSSSLSDTQKRNIRPYVETDTSNSRSAEHNFVTFSDGDTSTEVVPLCVVASNNDLGKYKTNKVTQL